MIIAKETGLPLLEGLTTAEDMPHTISQGMIYRARINSFQELPKDKQPPRDLWNKPYKLSKFFDEVFERKDSDNEPQFIEFNEEEVE